LRVFVGVEDVDDGVFAESEHEAVGGLGAAQLVQVGIEFMRFAAQIYRLAEKQSLNQRVGINRAYFVGFAAHVSGHTKCVAEAEPLVDLWIEPQLRARRPSTHVRIRQEQFIGSGEAAPGNMAFARGSTATQSRVANSAQRVAAFHTLPSPLSWYRV